jgi:hypothetical protein
MIFLFGMELNNYLAVSTSTSVIVDRSADGDFLRLDFNIRYIILNFVSQYKCLIVLIFLTECHMCGLLKVMQSSAPV